MREQKARYEAFSAAELRVQGLQVFDLHSGLSVCILFPKKHREGFFRAKFFGEVHRIKNTEYYAGRVKCTEHSTQSEVHQTEVHRVKCIESSA